MEFIIIASGIFSILGLSAGYVLRKIFHQMKLVSILVLVGLLIPWGLHHLAIIQLAENWISQENDPIGAVPWIAVVLGPIAVALISAFFVSVLNKLGRQIAVIPAFAFCITWYLTFPIVYSKLQWFKFDNVPTVWLFVWTVGATFLLLTYHWPKRTVDLKH